METTEETGLRSSPSAIFGAATTCLHACFLILQTLLILAGACPASEAKITQQKVSDFCLNCLFPSAGL